MSHTTLHLISDTCKYSPRGGRYDLLSTSPLATLNPFREYYPGGSVTVAPGPRPVYRECFAKLCFLSIAYEANLRLFQDRYSMPIWRTLAF